MGFFDPTKLTNKQINFDQLNNPSAPKAFHK